MLHRPILKELLKMSQPDITLYTAQTPNGIKISIALEELGYAVPDSIDTYRY